MTHIGLISDTHGYLDPLVFKYFKDVDEIWHAGDLGDVSVYNQLKVFKPLKAVYGNIDDHEIRGVTEESLLFECEQIRVLMTHIGGLPGKYPKSVRAQLIEFKPHIFVCGHSHILRVIYDKKFSTLFMNPGASGRQGLHHTSTLIRFSIDGDWIGKAEIIELGKRGRL